jgi:hypothetical protein
MVATRFNWTKWKDLSVAGFGSAIFWTATGTSLLNVD